MATHLEAPTAQQNDLLNSHPFTCNTCQVAFRSGDLQRTHMQSDWHRYNLKRRVAALPPLTSEVFAEKVLANKASAAATAARASFEKRCEACDKTFYSEGAHVNHLRSQKHRMLAARLNARRGNETESMADSTFSLGEPMDNASTITSSTINGAVEELKLEDELDDATNGMNHTKLDSNPDSISQPPEQDEEYEHKAIVQQCLFCNYISPTLDLNLNHMGRQHGFFIPEREYLVDLEGLINYLSETIQVLHQCTFCHKTVHTSSGVQTHMRDRGHCMIAYTTEDEQMDVGEFYDFRSTYSDEETEDDEDSEQANGGVSLGTKRGIKTTVQNDEGEDVEMDPEDDEGWESDSTLSSVPTDEITSVPVANQSHKFAKLDLHRHHSHSNPLPHKNSDGFHSHAHPTPHAVYHDEYELHLPSGRTAGHRSLRTYYRQNLRNYPTPAEQEQRMLENGHDESEPEAEDTHSRTQSNDNDTGEGRGRQLITRANGGLGMLGVSEAKTREARAVEKREQKREQRAQNRFRAGNERKGNFQKHYRDPLLQ